MAEETGINIAPAFRQEFYQKVRENNIVAVKNMLDALPDDKTRRELILLKEEREKKGGVNFFDSAMEIALGGISAEMIELLAKKSGRYDDPVPPVCGRAGQRYVISARDPLAFIQEFLPFPPVFLSSLEAEKPAYAGLNFPQTKITLLYLIVRKAFESDRRGLAAWLVDQCPVNFGHPCGGQCIRCYYAQNQEHLLYQAIVDDHPGILKMIMDRKALLFVEIGSSCGSLWGSSVLWDINPDRYPRIFDSIKKKDDFQDQQKQYLPGLLSRCVEAVRKKLVAKGIEVPLQKVLTDVARPYINWEAMRFLIISGAYINGRSNYAEEDSYSSPRIECSLFECVCRYADTPEGFREGSLGVIYLFLDQGVKIDKATYANLHALFKKESGLFSKQGRDCRNLLRKITEVHTHQQQHADERPLETCPELIEAITAGDFEKVRRLYEKPVLRRGALVAACAANNLAMVQYVLAEGGVVADEQNEVGLTPFHIACDRRNLEAVTLLAEYGANPDRVYPDSDGPLHKACAGGDVELAAVLLRVGANPVSKGAGNRTCFVYAQTNEVINRLIDAVLQRFIHEPSSRNDIIFIALSAGHERLLAALVARGGYDPSVSLVKVRGHEKHCWELLCFNTNVAGIEALVAAGVDTSCLPTPAPMATTAESRDEEAIPYCQTPVGFMCRWGAIKGVRALLDAGAYAGPDRNGRTPISFAERPRKRDTSVLVANAVTPAIDAYAIDAYKTHERSGLNGKEWRPDVDVHGQSSPAIRLAVVAALGLTLCDGTQARYPSVQLRRLPPELLCAVFECLPHIGYVTTPVLCCSLPPPRLIRPAPGSGAFFDGGAAGSADGSSAGLRSNSQ